MASHLGSYIVRDDADERYYSFDYRQIVTEGFRTIRTGELVRFHVSTESPDRAEFVIRLDQPDPAESSRLVQTRESQRISGAPGRPRAHRSLIGRTTTWDAVGCRAALVSAAFGAQ